MLATPTLMPVEAAFATVRRRQGAEGMRGLAPGLLVPEGAVDWWPAANLLHGDTGLDLDRLLGAAASRWGASPHAAAALAWRSYTYWLSLPVILGWAVARRVLLVHPDDVQLRFGGEQQLLQVGMRRLRWAVLPDDPLAGAAAGGELTVVGSESELLGVLRASLRESHLDPLLTEVQHRVRLGSRPLWGSLASAVAYAVIRGVEGSAETLLDTAGRLLSALDLTNLVSIDDGPEGLAVRRHTCCLAFTLPKPKVCASCCLRG
ncbi:(2Fe-2S)-binding protein [Natronosporangium hydrolyticum]|uniref:(2Fe-2S)-binding protein n=2 Tax=Natronosporangium hydrolyticum TaxID=2811111 RepID=A0A895YTV3_9ACTN|nr:(2Fe-2S)-binding protein [Natronosporangium hydrolyticum]